MSLTLCFFLVTISKLCPSPQISQDCLPSGEDFIFVRKLWLSVLLFLGFVSRQWHHLYSPTFRLMWRSAPCPGQGSNSTAAVVPSPLIIWILPSWSVPHLCFCFPSNEESARLVSWVTQLGSRAWACPSDPESCALIFRGTASHLRRPFSLGCGLSRILPTSIYFITLLSWNDCLADILILGGNCNFVILPWQP